MSAAVRLPDETPQLERGEAIARGIALVNQGHSYREAASRVGLNYATLWRAHKANEEELASLETDAEAAKRISLKARMAVELGVERMLRELPTCKETYVAPWTWTAARLAGIAEGKAEDGANPIIGALLERLSNRRASVQASVSVSLEGGETPSQGPVTLDIAPQSPNAPTLPAGEGIPQ